VSTRARGREGSARNGRRIVLDAIHELQETIQVVAVEHTARVDDLGEAEEDRGVPRQDAARSLHDPLQPCPRITLRRGVTQGLLKVCGVSTRFETCEPLG